MKNPILLISLELLHHIGTTILKRFKFSKSAQINIRIGLQILTIVLILI